VPHGRSSPIRKLVEWTFVSLDGVVDSPEWARPFLDDEHHRYALTLLDEADALLLGRKTYEGLADFWPKAEPGGSILKFGTGELDKALLEHGLVDEFYFSKAPDLVGRGERLFDGVEATLELRETTTFGSGVVVFRCGVRIAQTPPEG